MIRERKCCEVGVYLFNPICVVWRLGNRAVRGTDLPVCYENVCGFDVGSVSGGKVEPDP